MAQKCFDIFLMITPDVHWNGAGRAGEVGEVVVSRCVQQKH